MCRQLRVEVVELNGRVVGVCDRQTFGRRPDIRRIQIRGGTQIDRPPYFSLRSVSFVKTGEKELLSDAGRTVEKKMTVFLTETFENSRCKTKFSCRHLFITLANMVKIPILRGGVSFILKMVFERRFCFETFVLKLGRHVGACPVC